MNNLSGRHILVTRPFPQGADLAMLLENQGAMAYHIPALEIMPVAIDMNAFQADMIIFISANAVQYCPQVALSASIMYFSVGEATRLALEKRGICSMQGLESSSEGLLSLRALQDVQDKNIAIFCGKGGRHVLEATLIARGAVCQRYEVYERQCAVQETERLQQLLKSSTLDCVICTSVDNLICLKKMSGQCEMLLQSLPLVVVSQRIADVAFAEGFLKTLVIERAFNNAIIVEELIKWRKEHVF